MLVIGQCKCSQVVFMDGHMHSWIVRIRHSYCIHNLGDLIHDGEKLLATARKCYRLSFHRRQGCFSLKLRRPEDRTVSNSDNKTSTTSHADWVIVNLVTIETRKVSIRICIDVLSNIVGLRIIPLSQVPTRYLPILLIASSR